MNEAFTKEKGILIVANPYIKGGGGGFNEQVHDEYKYIYVSTKEIRKRILNGEPVYFATNQADEKRMIDSTLIDEAIYKGVERIYIENAIIVGNLAFG
ncbi:MAG: hypothetical protein H8D23_01840 [Candidatus Brocadiales bacterium]|nr:hypothetical protein [Candidatus Brocadiales bacterium]